MATNLDYNLVVTKFELYPKDEPDSYKVGFDVEVGNGQKFYKDTLVPLGETDGLSDDEIIALAWNNIDSNIEQRAEALNRISSFLGKKLDTSK